MAKRRTRMSDPRELPAYTISEAAHYLTVPAATVRYWSVGRDDYAPLIEVPAHAPTLLSFLNLTELHVLAAIRRTHEVKMPSIRRAIRYLAAHARQAMDKRHPLLSHALETDGLDLFIEQYGQTINISRAGQTAMREIMSRGAPPNRSRSRRRPDQALPVHPQRHGRHTRVDRHRPEALRRPSCHRGHRPGHSAHRRTLQGR